MPTVEGPDKVYSAWDVEAFASLLGGQRSDDAGDYVCNAWLYGVQRQLSVPVGFLHVPERGLDPGRLTEALKVWFSMGRPAS